MTYLDASVALAHLLAEDRRPPTELWDEPLVSSRLLQFELWTRIHARGLGESHAEAVHGLLARIGFLDLVPEVLDRASEPFPVPVRTLDALHLATIDFVRGHGIDVQIAAYDRRMIEAAEAMGIPTRPL